MALISKRAIYQYSNRDFNSFLWMKKLKEHELLEELNRLKVKPQFKTKPWLHQLVCFFIGLTEPRFLFLLDMGSGKSKLIMDLITQYQREKKVTRALVTVPRLINIGSWEEDIHTHSELEPILCIGKTIEEKWDTLMTGQGDLALVDYQGLCLAVCDKKKGKLTKNPKKMKMLRERFDFVGLDESHKLKNHENLWFSVVRDLTASSPYVYATTGTLFNKDPEDVWSQFYLVDQGETFGENLGLFRDTFFEEKSGAWKKERHFLPSQRPLLNQMIQNKSVRYNEREFSDVPDSVQIRRLLDFGEEQREHYLNALEGLISANGQLADLDAAWFRMRQITSGYLQWKDDHGQHTIHFKDNPKLEALEELLDECGDAKMVISHEYTESGRLITEMLKTKKIGHVWLYGGSKKDPIGMRRQFLDDPDCRVFVMNSESGGTGLDGLQKVCKYMVLYESPATPTPRRQVMKRVHRPGQKERAYFYDLTIRRSVDVGILDSVLAGVDFYSSVVDGSGLGTLKKMLSVR